VCLAGPVAAQDRIDLPEGCDAYVTVQMKSCAVSHHYTCAADPDGHQRRVDLVEDGIVYAGRIDAETQWIESFFPWTGEYETLVPDPTDPASFTDLLGSGTDSYDFETRSDPGGVSRYVGSDSLTGDRVVIDGVELLRTEYSIRQFDENGTLVWRATGSEFVSEEWRVFLSGTGAAWTPEDGEYEVDDSPVEFVFPGEPGFLSAEPKFGCGAVMSSLEGH
jgi:hypothetical protein